MQFRNLGKSGLRVSLVGLGCNNLGGRIDLSGSRKVVQRALDLGITLFDTADIYGNVHGHPGGSESALGEILGDRRKDVVLATKFGMGPREERDFKGGGSRHYIMTAVEASLRDRLDRSLSAAHAGYRDADRGNAARARRPRSSGQGALCRLLEPAGLAGRRGAVDRAQLGRQRYSLLARGIERERLPVAAAYGLGVLPYFPLANGLLTGKYRRDAPPPEGTRLKNTPYLANLFMTPRNWTRVDELTAFCRERGHRLLELAFSWLAARPQVATIIAGATRAEQVEQNVAAVIWSLGAGELAEIDGITAD